MSDALLYALSARGVMSFSGFKAAFNTLAVPPEALEGEKDLRRMRNRVIRRLDSLGHCEFDFRRWRVHTCPSRIVLLPQQGRISAVLTGARTPSLIKGLTEFVKENKRFVSLTASKQAMTSQALRNAELELPSSVRLEASETSHLEEISTMTKIRVNIGTPAAWSLAMFSAGLADIKLEYLPFRGLPWEKKVFDPNRLKFAESNSAAPGKQLIQYTDPDTTLPRHVITQGNQEAEVELDWGRYSILCESGRKVISYDRKSQQMAVPMGAPLPALLARAATLCSGLVPYEAYLRGQVAATSLAGIPVDVYRSVPQPVAKVISKKIKQPLSNLDIGLLEVIN